MGFYKGLGIFVALALSNALAQRSTGGSTRNSPPQPPPVSPPTPGNFSDDNATEISSGGVYVRVLGQSGKIMMGRTRNPSEDPNGLKVNFDAISELDKDFAVIGKGGRVKHSFNTFAKLSFTFSNITDDQYQNLSAKRLDFVANITSVGAILTVQMYLFEEEGNITQGDEVSQVSKGTLKFNIVIENWSFCGTDGETCKQGQTNLVGKYIDFVIGIKGKKAGQKKTGGRRKRTNAQEYDMGGASTVVLSGKARYDGSSKYENLTAGYPKMEMKGSSQLFTFRFRKFNSSVFYDPQLDLGSGNATTGENTTATPTPTPDTNLQAAQITAKILGQSGKMTIGRGNNADSDGDKVQVTFDEIKEIDSSGTPVGTSGASKHSFNTFASLDFNFSSIRDDTFGGLAAKRIDFSANIVDVTALLTVNVYIFTQKGEINVDGEKSSVEVGSVKFNIQLEGWDFCGNTGVTCKKGSTNEIGAGIEFVITIKGKGSAQKTPDNDQKKMTDGDEYKLGGSAALLLSKKISVDGGNYTNMASGYPKLETAGNKQSFIFRFPKFSSSVLYDPQILFSVDGSSSSSFVTSSLSLLITCLMILITRVFH